MPEGELAAVVVRVRLVDRESTRPVEGRRRVRAAFTRYSTTRVSPVVRVVHVDPPHVGVARVEGDRQEPLLPPAGHAAPDVEERRRATSRSGSSSPIPAARPRRGGSARRGSRRGARARRSRRRRALGRSAAGADGATAEAVTATARAARPLRTDLRVREAAPVSPVESSVVARCLDGPIGPSGRSWADPARARPSSGVHHSRNDHAARWRARRGRPCGGLTRRGPKRR